MFMTGAPQRPHGSIFTTSYIILTCTQVRELRVEFIDENYDTFASALRDFIRNHKMAPHPGTLVQLVRARLSDGGRRGP